MRSAVSAVVCSAMCWHWASGPYVWPLRSVSLPGSPRWPRRIPAHNASPGPWRLHRANWCGPFRLRRRFTCGPRVPTLNSAKAGRATHLCCDLCRHSGCAARAPLGLVLWLCFSQSPPGSRLAPSGLRCTQSTLARSAGVRDQRVVAKSSEHNCSKHASLSVLGGLAGGSATASPEEYLPHGHGRAGTQPIWAHTAGA